MMKGALIYLFLYTNFVGCLAQENPVKVIFDVTSADPKIHQSAIRHVNLMAENYPDSEFEVVIYSGSIDMVLIDKSSVKEDVEKFKNNSNVTFKVCHMTMDRKGIGKDQLIEGVETVPDGILEIVTKQKEGWGYIKEAQ